MGITLIKDNSALHLQAPGGTTIRNVEEIYVGDSAPTEDGYKVWVKPDEAETTQLASKSYVDEAISNVEGGNVDLTDYYTKQEVEKVIDDAIDTIELLEGPPGEPGKDGYTPIKGVDYYTEAEKQALIEEILEQIPEGGESLPSAEEVEF